MNSRHILPINTYRQFQTISTHSTFKGKIRDWVRDKVIFALSMACSDPVKGNWIRFPYYHHVFDDERIHFEKQLQYMKKLGDFISLDDAVTMLESTQPVNGRYFCITFDDGFKNVLTNAIPILLKYSAPATFFLPTGFIGRPLEKVPAIHNFYHPTQNIMWEFLSWDDCTKILQNGMSMGAHTVNHFALSSLSDEDAEKELLNSKRTIEDKLGIACHHFCAPIGIPGRDFIVDRDPQLAKKIGYRSFLTTKRGSVNRKSSPMLIERDDAVAMWDIYQLRYFFSQ